MKQKVSDIVRKVANRPAQTCRSLRSAALLLLLAMLLMLPLSCGKEEEKRAGTDADILVQVGDTALTRSEVESRIPRGLATEDSLRLFDAVVQNWVEQQLLVQEAKITLPSLERIDAMVEEYRLQLLANEYRRLLAGRGTDVPTEDSIRAYYAQHHSELILDRPLVKGLYIKIPSSSDQTASIRKWLFSGEQEDVDKLEQYGLKGAMQYDDFRDTWVEWNTIANLIPNRFGEPGSFLQSGYRFDRDISGAVYMLSITDVMPAGREMPAEYARNTITDILSDRMRMAGEDDLLQRLYKDAIRNKRLKEGSYTPMRFRQSEKPVRRK